MTSASTEVGAQVRASDEVAPRGTADQPVEAPGSGPTNSTWWNRFERGVAGRTHPPPVAIERASAEDLTSLVTDRGPVPMQVGAILLLDTPDGFDVETGVAALAERTGSVPRLRQRLRPVPLGCGRPVWVDDDDFDVTRHVRVLDRRSAGGETGLLALAADLVVAPLPRDRPLWSATLVTDAMEGRTAIIVVFHHVLADGIGGLAILAGLVDGMAVPGPTPAPRSAPTTLRLAGDAARSRLRSVTSLGAAVRRLRAAAEELRASRPGRPPPSSLNRPTGPRRQVLVARTDLEGVRAVAHAHGATVNDVVLTAAAGALGALLSSRDEAVDRVVASVPVSRRRDTTATELGNQVGVVPVELPTGPDPLRRLAEVAAVGDLVRRAPRGASAELLGPVFRLLARIGLFQWFIDRQRLVTTFVTNVRGPAEPVAFTGSPLEEVIPLVVTPGNVTVSFAALSYAGSLTITVICDPDVCPDAQVLGRALQRELDDLTVGREGRVRTDPPPDRPRPS